MALLPKIANGDWNAVRRNFQQLNFKYGPGSSPTFAGLTLTGLTASRLMASDATKGLVSTDLDSWVTGTANQITVTDDADGTITLSTPQNIHTGASPTFADLTLTDFGSGGETIADTLEDIINCGEMHAVTITDEGGVNISWGAGLLWDCVGNVFVITDSQASTGCTDNDINYLYWDRSGGGTALTLSTTRPDYTDDDILVGIIVCQAGDIHDIHTVNILSERESNTSNAIRDILQVVVVDGLIVSEDADATNAFDVEISAGTFYHFGTSRHNLAAGFNTRTTAMTRWYHSAGVWTFDTNAQIDMTEGTAGINRYDDLTNRVDGAANKYYKSMFMYSANMIHWIYPQAEYDTIAQAIAAPLPIIPGTGEYFPRSVAVIMKGNDAAFPTAGGTRWIDIRPLFGTSITGVVSDHGNLAGLTDDDHPQYIKDSEFTQNSGVLVGTAAGTFQEETGATLRTSLGLGTIDSPTFTGLTLTGFSGLVHAAAGVLSAGSLYVTEYGSLFITD